MGCNGAGKGTTGTASSSGLTQCGKSKGGHVSAQQPIDHLGSARMAAFQQNRPRSHSEKDTHHGVRYGTRGEAGQEGGLGQVQSDKDSAPFCRIWGIWFIKASLR